MSETTNLAATLRHWADQQTGRFHDAAVRAPAGTTASILGEEITRALLDLQNHLDRWIDGAPSSHVAAPATSAADRGALEERMLRLLQLRRLVAWTDPDLDLEIRSAFDAWRAAIKEGKGEG